MKAKKVIVPETDVLRILSEKDVIHVTDQFGRHFRPPEIPSEEGCPDCHRPTVVEYRRIGGKGYLVEECTYCEFTHSAPHQRCG